MRLLLSSILLALLVSCASYPKKNGLSEVELNQRVITNSYFSDAAKDYIYKANIEAFDNSFGGIFIVKKLGKDNHRIVFTTEMGNKIFDFTFQGDDFKVNHIIKKMDRKILINILKNDFRVLIKESLSVEKTFKKGLNSIYKTNLDTKNYYHFSSKEHLNKIVRVSRDKEKVEFTFSEISDNIAKKIEIAHKNFNLTIHLKAI